MANSNVKFGLKPIGVVGGVAGTTGATPYFIKSDASAMFQGSPVIATNDGTIAITGSATGDTYKHLGVFAGCEYVDATSGEKKFSNYWPGSGSADSNYDIVGFVYDNPFQRFVICTDATFTNKANARLAIFESAAMITANAGNTTTGLSNAQLDTTTPDAADPSFPLKVVGIQDDVENQDYTAAGLPVIVIFNNHALLDGSAEAVVS